LAEDWPIGCLGHFARGNDPALGQGLEGPQIIRDIDPYQAVGGDIANGGKAPKIMGRRQHREYLKRNNYIEVGNETLRPSKPDYGPEVTEREVRQVYERLRDSR
jgi:hypothetical protein